MIDFPFVIAGFAVGLIVGLTGVGGGSLMTPLLIFFFGVKPHLAVGTDLLFAAFTKMGGTWKLARSKAIDWRVVLHLSLGSIPASLLTLYVIHLLGPASASSQQLMKTTLGVALLLTAVATFYKAVWGKSAPRAIEAGQAHLATQPRRAWMPVLLGAAVGTLVTISSVGAGAIGVIVLMLLYPLLPTPRIVAADIAHAVPLTLVAGLGHASLGSVDWHLLIQLLLGSLPGIWLGSHWVLKAPDRVIRSVLSIVLAYAGSKLIAVW